jgi:hypothetical protein
MRKVIIWFLVCLILAIYAKTQNFISDGQILGSFKTAP